MSTTILPKSPYLDMKDFDKVYKYKFIIPTIYILCWIGMIFGPIYFGITYAYISTIVGAIGIAKFSSMFVAALIGVIKNRILVEKVIKKNKGQKCYYPVVSVTQQIYHTIIIPSYKESPQLLGETLDILAAHDKAQSNYIIVLAMEKHQKDSDKKALELISKYNAKFRLMHFTVHQMRQFQQKGKASNVSWSVQHLEPFFQKNMIEEENVFLTIIDADSWAPNIYFEEVELYLRNNYQRKNKTCFSTPQIYTRNQMQVPVISRVGDFAFSQMHCSNLYAFSRMTFPLSNYSVSYSLMKKIGFWDTVQDAIGQDFHTSQKIIWKTDGDIDCVPIFAPFNQTNVSTGNGYWEDFKARFWQSERHARGLADYAYNIHKIMTQKLNFRKIFLFLCVSDFCLFPVIIPWFAFSSFYQQWLLKPLGVQFIPSFSDDFTAIVSPIFMFLSTGLLILYEIMKRQSTTHLYNLKNDNLIRSMIEVNIFSAVSVLFGWTPACVIANFGNLKSGRQYRVAQKKAGEKQALLSNSTQNS